MEPNTNFEEVFVANPTHPLYGRHFKVVYPFSPRAKRVLVFLYDDVKILLPITAIYPEQTSTVPCKLTLEAITELVEQGIACGICKLSHQDGGEPSSKRKKKKSF